MVVRGVLERLLELPRVFQAALSWTRAIQALSEDNAKDALRHIQQMRQSYDKPLAETLMLQARCYDLLNNAPEARDLYCDAIDLLMKDRRITDNDRTYLLEFISLCAPGQEALSKAGMQAHYSSEDSKVSHRFKNIFPIERFSEPRSER